MGEKKCEDGGTKGGREGRREGRTYLNLFMMAFAERSTPLMICRS